jgi:hypothetical protein
MIAALLGSGLAGRDFSAEGKRSWWVGRASNPVGGAMRRRVGSTPIPFRHFLVGRSAHAGSI